MALDSRSVNPRCETDNEPLWRKHFPVDTDREKQGSRRAFLGGLTIAGGAMACGQAALRTTTSITDRDATDYPPLLLDKRLEDLAVGQSLLFHYPSERSPCLLIRLSIDEVVAFSQKCTHLACPVVPEIDKEQFHCPCHHGVFDMRTGQPLAGPPRTPLPRVRIAIGENGELSAVGIE